MSHTLKAYEIGQYYDEIMNNIIKQKPICRKGKDRVNSCVN